MLDPTLAENECPPICGDHECIEEWKNFPKKISKVEDSKKFSCVIGSLKTDMLTKGLLSSWKADSMRNDSFYDVYFQTMIPIPNCDVNSTSKDDFEYYCRAVTNRKTKYGVDKEYLKLEICNQDGCNWNPDTAHYDLNYQQILVSLANVAHSEEKRYFQRL